MGEKQGSNTCEVYERGHQSQCYGGSRWSSSLWMRFWHPHLTTQGTLSM